MVVDACACATGARARPMHMHAPPLLPPLMAASICTPSRSIAPWLYSVTCGKGRRAGGQVGWVAMLVMASK